MLKKESAFFTTVATVAIGANPLGHALSTAWKLHVACPVNKLNSCKSSLSRVTFYFFNKPVFIQID